MRYVSTRDKTINRTSAEAIARGICDDGGLFAPAVLPSLSVNALHSMCTMSYQQRAVYVMGAFLEDYTFAEISAFANRAYGTRGFDTQEIAPLHKLDDDTYFLELWHGPTCAFKDMALQMLPHLMSAALGKIGERKQVCILAATSGDTGKAALEGFCDVDGTKILVFYPKDGVSEIQRLQMTTQAGRNVGVCAVTGNFDDAQAGVKRLFTDTALRSELEAAGWLLSSANSINWGRLLPQIVYYVSAYCDLIGEGRIGMGDQINVCVPTGNFGNILAAFYAKRMGLPIHKLICASNANNVLTTFINTGVYDRNIQFYNTISPSMDILVSSNLERLLFELSDKNDRLVAGYMQALASQGRYVADDRIQSALGELFWANDCSDEKTKLVINATFQKYQYLIDPHTAVAYDVLNHYRHDSGDAKPCVVVSTASPYKFCESVLDALGDHGEAAGLDRIDRLAQVTGTAPPGPLLALKNKRERFLTCVEKENMRAIVNEFLK